MLKTLHTKNQLRIYAINMFMYFNRISNSKIIIKCFEVGDLFTLTFHYLMYVSSIKGRKQIDRVFILKAM